MSGKGFFLLGGNNYGLRLGSISREIVVCEPADFYLISIKFDC